MNRFAPLLSLAFAISALPAQDNLELGKMWTFENAPLDYWKRTHGFEATPEWLDKVRLASLRMASGCSASFVSPKGLVMTNHHCVRGFVAQVSPKEQDWVKDGFVAATEEQEVKLPNCVLQQLVAMKDVTTAMNEGVASTDDDATVASKRKANEAKILSAEGMKDDGTTPQVVKLFQGAQYQLYTYRKYDDVRLVCAPHLQSSHFGGDPDNFVYPRYGIDFSFIRAYEGGKPANTKDHYFKWCAQGPKEGDLVFVTGNPGSTSRLATLAQLEYMRDVQYPIQLEALDNQIAIYHKHMAKDAQLEKALRTQVLGQENSQKAIRGSLNGLLDPKLMAAKKKAEEVFRAKVMGSPEHAAKFGKAWDKLAEVAAQRCKLQPKSVFQTPGNSAILTRAMAIVRAVTSDNAEEKQQAREFVLGNRLPPRSELGLELLTDTLKRASKHLGADDPFIKALLQGEPVETAVQGILKSKLYDDATVKKLLDGTEETLRDTKDRVVNAALVVAPLVAQNQKLAAQLKAQEDTQGALIGQALFAVYGTKVSPDATFTLRISDGVAKGYPCNGSLAPWRTTFYGLYARNAEFENKYPFNLPQEWLDRKSSIEMTKSVDFASTNDIIGGNSGSPMINRDREIVGLIFDGNMEMLPNNFLYRDDLPRAVSVHADAIIETMVKVLDAQRVADELAGKNGG